MLGNFMSGRFCTGNIHMYPETYAGDPQYAEQYFSICLCGKKRKVTTFTEVDNQMKQPCLIVGKNKKIGAE